MGTQMPVLLIMLSGLKEKEAHGVWCRTWHTVGAQIVGVIIIDINQPPQVTFLRNLSPQIPARGSL